MSTRALASTLAAYAIAGVITFGHAWSEVVTHPGAAPGDQVIMKTTGAAIVSMFWPLYWSVELFNREGS